MAQTKQNRIPRFAVVGHPNKGKSSIVATLSHNEDIAISPVSGTTTESHSYPLVVDGQVLYELIDTPGFQRPRQILDWLEQRAVDSSQRADAIQDFVKTHQHTQQKHYRFKDEVELLSPIVAGAGIIYVVDGSQPYAPEYESEMTILQWTGRPRMALINPIGGDAYVEQWQQALDQYFSLTRVFNPLAAKQEEQLALIESFKVLDPSWIEPLGLALQQLDLRSKRRFDQAARIIAEDVTAILSYKDHLPALSEEAWIDEGLKQQLSVKYENTVKGLEATLHGRLKSIYQHDKAKTHNLDLEINYTDLFDQENWYLFGLSRARLLALSASAGAAAGGVLDVGLGGASFMTGAFLGGMVSGAATLFASNNPSAIRVKGIPFGGKQVTIGPVKDLQFALVVLGRAVDIQRKLAQRVHADQSTIELKSNEQSWLDPLSHAQQVQLSQTLLKLAKKPLSKDVDKLSDLLKKLLF